MLLDRTARTATGLVVIGMGWWIDHYGTETDTDPDTGEVIATAQTDAGD